MHNITLISTIHSEMGNCNAMELSKIINEIKPEVVFLEALKYTYNDSHIFDFSNFGIFHKKLEIAALQICSSNIKFKYVPVLDKEISKSFDEKFNLITQNNDWRSLMDRLRSFCSDNGFKFLNSDECIMLHEEMRIIENSLLKGQEIELKFQNDINFYEDNMINNIYSFCEKNHFNNAIFMCGAAHRKSIIEKINNMSSELTSNINWHIFGS